MESQAIQYGIPDIATRFSDLIDESVESFADFIDQQREFKGREFVNRNFKIWLEGRVQVLWDKIAEQEIQDKGLKEVHKIDEDFKKIMSEFSKRYWKKVKEKREEKQLEFPGFEKEERQLMGSPGGKSRIAEEIVSYIPQHKIYVEPFAGGLAVFFAKLPSPIEVLNDKNPDIAFMYKFVQVMTPEEFEKLKEYDWKNSKKIYDDLILLEPKNDVEKFRKLYYIHQTSYGELGEDYSLRGRKIDIDKLLSIQKRLSGAKIFNRDYQKIIEKFDSEDTFFYFDPPYASCAGLWGKYAFDEKAEAEMIDKLKKIKGKFILSYEDTDRKKFAGFNVQKIECIKFLPRIEGERETRKELLVSNFPLKKLNFYLESSKKEDSNYPEHPETILLKNEYYPKGLKEKDVWNYYDKMKLKILPYLKGRKILLRMIVGKGKDLVVRHDPKTNKFITISDEKEFDRWNNGRVVSFYTEMKAKDNFVRVDLDANEKFPFSRVKDVATEIYNLLKKNKFIKNVGIKYSGRVGFHIVAEFLDKVSTGDLRKEIDELKKEIDITKVPSL